MSQSGVAVNPDCINAYTELKNARKHKYVIYKLSDDMKEFVVEETSPNDDWEEFRNKLKNATTKTKTGAVGKGPRFAVYDFSYNTADGPRSKVTFVAWVPDDAPIQSRMVYASSKEALKRNLTGIAAEIQANDANEDLEYEAVVANVSKNTAV